MKKRIGRLLKRMVSWIRRSLRLIVIIVMIVMGSLSAMSNSWIWSEYLRKFFWRAFIVSLIVNVCIDLYKGLYKKEIQLAFKLGIPAVIASVGYLIVSVLSYIMYMGSAVNILYVYFTWKILIRVSACDNNEDDDDEVVEEGKWVRGVFPWTHIPNPFVKFQMNEDSVCHQIFWKEYDREIYGNIKNWSFEPDLTVGKIKGGFTFKILPDKWGEAVEVWGHMPYRFALQLDDKLREAKKEK